jgi:glutamate/tyrosine decarboxylase-like PLP-dependent enzyme
MDDVSKQRIWSGASPEEIARDLEPLVAFQAEGIPLEAVAALVGERLLPHLCQYDLPSFHSFFNAFPEKGAAYGARVALDWNQGVTNWQVSPGGAVLEELCCAALCRLFDLDPGADCTPMYCGTYANQQAIYMALHRHAERQGFSLAEEGLQGFGDRASLVIVTSTEAHFSVKHAARMLGLGERSIVTVGVDQNRHMNVEELDTALTGLTGGDAGPRYPFCVVATAGTTSTGSVDPLAEVADVCAEHDIWLHADGAYGFGYALVPEWQPLYAGAERADSITWDPHKQFGAPIPSSILFARRAEDLHRMAIFSSYFNREDAAEPNPGLKSIPSTRPLSALPLVTSIRYQGLNGIIERLRKPLQVIREIHDFLDGQPGMEALHRPDTGILCFRVLPRGCPEERLGAVQQHVYETLLRGGKRSLSISELDGKACLRIVALSPSVTVEAVRETLLQVRQIAESFR